MANTAGRPARPTPGGKAAILGGRPSGSRHPLVAVAMVLPVAMLLSVVFGGWEAVLTQASSFAGLLGR